MGANHQNFQQALLDSAYQQWLEKQNDPYRKLDIYSALIGSAPRQSSTSSSGGRSNPFTSALGGAATGASLGSAIPVIGTGIGAAIGGGLGLLGAI